MRARIAWIIGGIALVAGLVWWRLHRSPVHGTAVHGTEVHGNRNPDPAGDAGTTSGPRRVFPRTMRLRPGAPPEVAPTSGTPRDFDAEVRDPAWAIEMEAAVGERLAEVAGTSGIRIDGVECRATACRFVIEAKDEDSLGAAVSRLEEPGGLVGLADVLVIGALERGDDDVRLIGYARFER